MHCYGCNGGINFEGDGHSTIFTSTEGRSSPAVSESSQCSWRRSPDDQNRQFIHDWMTNTRATDSQKHTSNTSVSDSGIEESSTRPDEKTSDPAWRPHTHASKGIRKSCPQSRNHEQDHTTNKQKSMISPESSRQSRSAESVSSTKMFKLRLKEEFQYLNEEIYSGERQKLNDVFIEQHVTEDPDSHISDDRQIMRRNMFEGQHIRSVLMKGDAGTGKTVTVQKFILDWAEEKSNTHIDYIFPIPFQKLSIIRETLKKCSFMELLQQCFENTEDLKPDSDRIMLVFDGLNEFNLPLDFQNTKKITDIHDPASVSDLLTNLIMRNLLPNAQIWITSRPAAANQIPDGFIDRVTEIQGFNDQQKEEYFRKSISDQRMSDKVIRHIQTSPRISSMCYLPDYCRIIAAIPEKMFRTDSDDFPKTLTQMYSRLLLAQTELMRERRESIVALGRIAFHLLENRNSLFCYEHLKKCGIRDESDLIRSSIIKKTEDKSKRKLLCFVNHRTQEFLAALYVTEVINVNNKLQLRDLSSLKLDYGERCFTDCYEHQKVMKTL
ncbi:protein NLRC3-like isoform X2 [Onychostoma macrolepis]|uniref:protein NLRC3-like isoform X2 n=1 Tax=Onychostoma macrolepis TaxID=369639 RepID=UPI00272C9003|nr:protein NLRC3-like isoform X2 [Onychostoma macrolepis]